MNFEQILRIGAQTFQSEIGDRLADEISLEDVMQALSRLLPGDGNAVDLQALVARLQESGLKSVAASWLGDDENEDIGGDQVRKIFDDSELNDFAERLGLGRDDAVEGLQSALPAMLDKASAGGTLKIPGGVGGVMNMAGKLFGN